MGKHISIGKAIEEAWFDGATADEPYTRFATDGVSKETIDAIILWCQEWLAERAED